MAEKIDEWPRVHTCLYNWCPARRLDCDRCDDVVRIIKNQEPLGKEFSDVLTNNLFELYAR